MIKNRKKLLLLAAAVIVLLFFEYLTHMSSNGLEGITNLQQGTDEQKIIDSINIQNNTLANYFNSLYDSQTSAIMDKYYMGSISREERDKQLIAVTKNRELTMNTLNKLLNAKKDLFTGNITKEDILIRLNSFDDINSDIKTEINATLNGY
jgi:hypothetical protein